MNEKTPVQHIQAQRMAALEQKKRAILSMDPDQAVSRILSERHPAALVHSFPEEDLYCLIHDIGPEDALSLLALASSRQLDFILDQEIWEKDRIDVPVLANWIDLMLRADAPRFIKWLMTEKTGLLEFFLYQTIDVKIREYDQDPSDFYGEFITHDNVHYVSITPEGLKDAGADPVALLKTLLDGMADMDFADYRKILVASLHVLPAEAEEEALRWRTVRLAEKGFVPFEEAVGIYQPILPERLSSLRASPDKRRFFSERLAAPAMRPLILSPGENVFVRALGDTAADERFAALQTEFAALCNRLAVADHKSIKDKKTLALIVRKACGFIAMGLELLTKRTEGQVTAVHLLFTHPVADIFRVGYGRVAALKAAAQAWLADSWFSRQGLPLQFWGEERVGILGGLLLKRPRFFDNYRTGVLYREFESSEDLAAARTRLDETMAFDRLLASARIHVHPSVNKASYFYDNLVLTLWARHELGLAGDARPIPLDAFRRFYANLWEKEARPKKVADPMKSAFLAFLAEAAGLTEADVIARVGPVLEQMMSDIEIECGKVSPEDLDPRFFRLFLVE